MNSITRGQEQNRTSRNKTNTAENLIYDIEEWLNITTVESTQKITEFLDQLETKPQNSKMGKESNMKVIGNPEVES